MNFEYNSRVFGRFDILDKMMYPIAIRGIPIASILRILSVLLLGFFSLNQYDSWNNAYIRNVHIVIIIAVIYTVLIYADDIKHAHNYFFYMPGSLAIIFNLFVLTDTGYSSDGMSKESLLISTDLISLFFLSFSLISIKDKYFYSNYLPYSSVPQNMEKVFALTKALMYGKNHFSQKEFIDLLYSISLLYEENGYSVIANRVAKLSIAYTEYYHLLVSITSRELGGGFSPEFKNTAELIHFAEIAQKENKNI